MAEMKRFIEILLYITRCERVSEDNWALEEKSGVSGDQIWADDDRALHSMQPELPEDQGTCMFLQILGIATEVLLQDHYQMFAQSRR